MTERDIEEYKRLNLDQKLHGTPVSRLPEHVEIGPNDLFLFSRCRVISSEYQDAAILNEYYDGRILIEDDGTPLVNEERREVLCADMDSFAVRYSDLCCHAAATAKANMALGSMAWENVLDWAPSEHNHDDIYTKFSVGTSYDPPAGTETVDVMTIHISDFAEDGTMTVEDVQIVAPVSSLPKIDAADIGTVKFVGVPNLMGNMRKYGDLWNVDIFAEDFDGWVYPNGTTFTVDDGEFKDARSAYGGGSDTQFTVPDFRNFVKMNPGAQTADAIERRPFSNAVPPHTHDLDSVSMSGTPTSPKLGSMNLGSGGEVKDGNTMCGHGNPQIQLADVTVTVAQTFDNGVLDGLVSKSSDPALDVETKPTHTLMPVMVFIGGR